MHCVYSYNIGNYNFYEVYITHKSIHEHSVEVDWDLLQRLAGG